jgi:plastocyanin
MGQNQGTVNGPQATQMYQYFNPDYDVTMKYPSTWSVNETDLTAEDRVNLIAEFVSPLETFNDTYAEYVQINRDNGIFYDADLNEYLQEGISSYTNSTNNFTLIGSSTSETLSGQPAYSLTYTQTLSGENGQQPTTLKNFEIGILVNNTAYYVTYIGQEDRFDRYLPIVKQMINSFKLLLPVSTNNTNSTIGLETSTVDVNQTNSNSTLPNLLNSNQTAPSNLTTTAGEKNLPLLKSANDSSENNKTIDIQISTTEKNGSSETVNFIPREVVVDSNTNVIWTNNHSSVHTITSANNNTLGNNASSITTGGDETPLFDSDYMNTGEKFSYTFTQPGRFDYFDKNNENLKGTVFVKRAPVQINNSLSPLDAVNITQLSTNLISNSQPDNNESRILGNLSGSDNPTVNSDYKILSQLIQTLRQAIN